MAKTALYSAPCSDFIPRRDLALWLTSREYCVDEGVPPIVLV
jgi:hypothetical protein